MKTGLEGLEESVLPLVAKPGRYLAPAGFRPSGDFDRAGLRVCIVQPEPLETASRDVGFHALLLELRRAEGSGPSFLVVDLALGYESDFVLQLRDHEWPAFSLVYRRPLRDFDLLLIRASSLLTVSRALALLSLAGIPDRAEKRGGTDPLVVLAGDAAWYPESTQTFADAFLLGDPEAILPHLLEVARRGTAGWDRRETLFRISELDGVFVPVFGATDPGHAPEGVWLAALPPQSGEPFLPLVETDLLGTLLEVAREAGPECPVSPPGRLRARGIDDALRGAEWVLGSTGEGMLLLGGEAAGRHPELGRLLEALNLRFGPSGVQVFLAQVDPACFCPGVARELQKSRQGDLHFAPVAPSERLRDRAGRPLSHADLTEALEIALRGDWPGVRVRYVLGMPGETREDREEGLDLLDRLSQSQGRETRKPRVAVELRPFLPVRGTPWESEAGIGIGSWTETAGDWRRRLNRSKVRVSASTPVPAALEAALRRAGERGSPVLSDLAAFWEHLPPDPERAARVWGDFWAHVAPRLDETGNGSSRRALCLATDPVPGRAETEWGPIGGADPARPPAPASDEGGRRPRRGMRTREVRLAERFRLRVSKAEPVRFLSHLDVTRALLRAFRRSRIPLAVSGGKDRRPKVSFGPPLPLGMTSTAEFLDITFVKEVPESFVRSLNESLPEGLAVMASAPIRSEPASLSSAIQIAKYEVSFPDALIDRFLDGLPFDTLRARLEDRVVAALAATSLPITKGRGDDRKTFNARPSLLRAEVVRDDGGRPALSLGLTLHRPDSARPELWTAALLDWADVDERLLRVHRSGLYIPGRQGWLDPLDVVAPGFEWWRQPVRGGTVL